MEDEDISREAIEGFHSKGNSVWTGDLVNKGSFLTQVKLITFFDGLEMPFEIDGSLNIKTRMPFAKARKLLPKPMFDPAHPMISCVEPLRYKNLAYLYTEVRPFNDFDNNGFKTAEFLLAQEWVAVIQTSKETKMYIFPTCSLSHELGITHKNHPQMLHGLFVKFLVNKDARTSQGISVSHLYKAGLTKPDQEISREKVTPYQSATVKSNDKEIAHTLHNGAVKTEPTFDATTSDKIIEAVINKVADSISSANHLEAKPAASPDGHASKKQLSKEPELKPGQKRKLSDSVGASPAKRTRASIHSSVEQLLAGKTARNSQSYPGEVVADINSDDITIADEVFQPAEQCVMTTSTRELHSIIKPIVKEIYESDSPLKPVTSEAKLLVEKPLTADPTNVDDAEFNVPKVVYDGPCKRPKSILKGGSRSEPENELSTPPPLDDYSPTITTREPKIPRKIGLAEYKKRHKDRKDSEDPVDDSQSMLTTTVSTSNKGTVTTTKTGTENEDIALTIDLPRNGTLTAVTTTADGKGSNSDDVASSSDGTVTSKANVSVSFKEESKPESSLPSKSDLQVVSYSKSQSIMKSPIKIPPHPMSVLTGPTTSGPFLSHKYTTTNLTADLQQMSAQFYGGSQYGAPAYPSEWPSYTNVFNSLLPTPPRPYLLHPASAPPLPPSSILMGPPVYDPLPTATISNVESEMAQVEDLRERFTKTLQNELKRVIPSTESSRDSSPQPRRCRSLSRSPSPSLRKSRRGRSPHRFRKSSSRSQSLDSCRGSDREQTRSRSKSPRSHRSYRSRHRHRSSSRESGTESRRHFRSNKRSSRIEKRRERYTQKYDTHSSTNVKSIGTQTIDEINIEQTKLVYEKEVQTDMLLFVHSKGSQTHPVPESSREAQTDNSMCSAFFNNFAQYLETYPNDVFHFNDILSSSIKYLDQEITRLFHPDGTKQEPLTLYPKQLRRVLECDYMRKLKRTKLPLIIVKERQASSMYSASADAADRPGTPLMDDNQPVVCLPTTTPADDAYDSSGLSNSDILSDTEGSDDDTPNIDQLLSQYSNGTTAQAEEGSTQSTTEVDNTVHTNRSGNDSINNSEKYIPDVSSVSSNEALTGHEEVGMPIKKENGETDLSFVPVNSKLYQSPSQSPTKVFTGKHNDHNYTSSTSAKGQPHTAVHDTKCADSTHLTVLGPGERKKTPITEFDSDTKRRPGLDGIPLNDNYFKNSPHKSGGSPSSDDTPSIDDMEVAMYNEGKPLLDTKSDKEKGSTLELLTTSDYGTHSKEQLHQTIVESDHDIVDMDISSNSSLPSSSMENTPDRETGADATDTSKPTTSEKEKDKKSSGKSNANYSTKNTGKHSPYSGRTHYQAAPCKYRPPLRHPQPQLMYPYGQPYAWHSWNRRGGYWGGHGPPRY